MTTVTVWKFDTPSGADEASDAVFGKVAAELRGTNAELIKTNLSNEDEARLREAFADD
jgi:uncharacterized membrane protein